MTVKNRIPIVFCLVLASFLCFSELSAAEAPPRLVIDVTSVDFGQVDETEPQEKIFMLRNEGKTSLKIDNIKSS